jgi:hypothetical protein
MIEENLVTSAYADEIEAIDARDSMALLAREAAYRAAEEFGFSLVPVLNNGMPEIRLEALS